MKTAIINKPDILGVIENETGARLRGRGPKSLWMCCPFHADKFPSLKVDIDRQNFYCFGCGAHGDVLDFVMKLRNVSFKDALKVLGLDDGHPYRPDPELVRKRERERRFRQWERDYFTAVSAEYRLIAKALDVLDPFDAADLLKRKSVLEYYIEILSGRDDAEKVALHEAVQA